MSYGIHYAISQRLYDVLTKALITDIADIVTTTTVPTLDVDGNPVLDEDGVPTTHEVTTTTTDPTQAGVIVIGPLQGNPDPDTARISVEIFENDPDSAIGGVAENKGTWNDEVEEIECGGSITWRRRFSIKTRCLFVNTRETLDVASQITSTIRQRIEEALLKEKFSGVVSGNEYVSHRIFLDSFESEVLQAGGPDAYDFRLKFRFELFTTNDTIGA